MAENKRPLIAVDNPSHINFATIKDRTVSRNNNKSPMASDRHYNAGGRIDAGADHLSVLVDTARMQLISPPPEEILRKNQRLSVQFTPSLLADAGASPVNPSTHGTTTAAKRKRTQPAPTSSTPSYSRGANPMNQDNDVVIQSPQPMEATPNPKPRKQGRRHARQPSFESPTQTLFAHLGSSPVSNDNTSRHHTPSKSKTKKVIIKSPHANNPDADFIDEISVPALALPALRRTSLGARSRRSATPIPPYEPPTDVFTPPREVFLSPMSKSMSKSSKRKTKALASGSKSAKSKKKGSTSTIVTAVKQELPDIDLTLPMPPPSPTDDPLLLSGPCEPDIPLEPTSPRRRELSSQARMEQEVDGDLPPSSPEPPLAVDDEEAVRVFNCNRSENVALETSTDESMQLDPDDAGISPVRLFDLNGVFPSSNGGWTDSEQEPTLAPGGMEGVDEGEGEYTGRWRMMLVRTKQDPPSSATRGRMEEWGRPISPFPKKVARLSFLEEQEDEREHQEFDHQSKESQQEEEIIRRDEEMREEEEVRQMSIEPEEEEEEEEEVRRMSVEPEQSLKKEEQEVRQLSVEVGDDEELASPSVSPDLMHPQFTENLACGNQTVPIPALEPRRQPSPAPAIEVPVFPSIGSSPEPLLSPHPTELEHETMPATTPDENSWTQTSILSEKGEDDDQSSDDPDELSIVKITSADPRAAARAAAILKQHDYDCYTNIEVKQRHLEAKHRRKSEIEFTKEFRRRDVFSSGVAKGSRRRSTSAGMGVIGDRVFIPGSPAITLPELLQEAELEVRHSPQSLTQKSVLLGRRDPFKTPMAMKYSVQTVNTRMADQKAELCDDVEEREWTKEDWKHLDACFTDRRLEVGSRLAGAEENVLAPVDMVSIDDVVDKFVFSKGGLKTITRFGALWSRDNLLERTRALQKKQRSEHIALPTTPYTPLSVGSNSSALGGKERTPCMQVPEFTPLRCRAAPPRKSRPTLPQPAIHDVALNDSTPHQQGLPPTLLAPRYSLLLEEAIAISQEGSILSSEQETQDSFQQSEVEDTSHSSEVPSTTIGKRVKGFLFSYLPTLPKSSSRKGPLSLQPSLPIPPGDILSKPRGPVVTPARAPLSKPKHPKELVVLHPAPQLQTTSYIPRMKKPQRLVELRPPAPPPTEPTPIPRPRRSSGSSVKDLVRGFEEMQSVSKRNVGWKKYTDKRPRWKP